MNLVERLNARFNNVIHDGLALVGAVVDPWLAKLERQAMSNALGRDFGLDYGDVLAAAEAEVEVHEPAPCVCGHLREDHYRVGGFIDPCSKCDCLDLLYESSAELWASADPSPVSVGDIGPGAGMVPPPPPAPGPSKCTCPTAECELLAEDICDEAEEAELLDEFMELGEYLDTATAEELAAIRQHTEVSRADLELHLRWYTTARVSPEVVAQSLLDSYRITPR
ncbi:gp51 [Mycobacterium phage Fruitloop]|uniref:Uncharacterized protein n=2 Tax=Cheoctovirus TaxID=1623281 RepID=B5U4Q0_9CAUD|nr:gp51 [Mycobacterium phage Fruitloop]YP_009636462.1 hypothetical protein FGG21_gp049 [Mycobacterium phage DLane]ACI12364.1 hypothetical protein FRUITLOOP_51 [Mycobacterium phage Fruitloop]AEK08593.1 hypothetical protein PBI_DLANE_49 [Mycobacterium phage DLane]